jgi:hypothetical protein
LNTELVRGGYWKTESEMVIRLFSGVKTGHPPSTPPSSNQIILFVQKKLNQYYINPKKTRDIFSFPTTPMKSQKGRNSTNSATHASAQLPRRELTKIE